MAVLSRCTHEKDRCCRQIVEAIAQAQTSGFMPLSAHSHVPSIQLQMQAAPLALYPASAKFLGRSQSQLNIPCVVITQFLGHDYIVTLHCINSASIRASVASMASANLVHRSRRQSKASVFLSIELPIGRRVVPQANGYWYWQQILNTEWRFQRDLSAANQVLA